MNENYEAERNVAAIREEDRLRAVQLRVIELEDEIMKQQRTIEQMQQTMAETLKTELAEQRQLLRQLLGN